jgi:hypothetical protein
MKNPNYTVEDNLKYIIDAELQNLQKIAKYRKDAPFQFPEDQCFYNDVEEITCDARSSFVSREAVIHGIVQIYKDYGIEPLNPVELAHINAETDKRNIQHFDDRTNSLVMQYLYVALIAAVALTVFTVGHLGLIPFLTPGSHIIQAMWIFSFTLCTGITYGITADLIATRRAPSYFLYGHQPGQTALINSNDPNMVAFAWGLAATWHVSAIVGLAFAVVALCCPLSPTIMMSMMAAPITLLPLAYIISTCVVDKHSKSRPGKYCNYEENRQFSGEHYSTIQNIRWWQTGIVNGIGYLTLPVAGIGILTTACVLSTVGLHSVFWGLWLPVGVLSAQVVVMGAAALYMHINQGLKIPGECYPCSSTSIEAEQPKPQRTKFFIEQPTSDKKLQV